MQKPAKTDFPLLPAIVNRWSPRIFDPAKTLGPADMAILLEAARWAPSSSNTQPWRFVYAFRGEPQFDALIACAVEGNQRWAKNASVICFIMARTHSDSGRELWHRRHDVGLALENLLLQATANGLAAHPFGGFDGDKVIAAAGVPEGFEPCTGLAIGHFGDLSTVPDTDREREMAERHRLPVEAFAFHGKWSYEKP